MIVRLLCGLALLATLLLGPAALALGADPDIEGDATPTDFMLAGQDAVASEDGMTTAAAQDSTIVTSTQQTVCAYQGRDGCAEPQTCGVDDLGELMEVTATHTDGTVTTSFYCAVDAVADEPIQITDDMVLRAFKRIPLPASELVVQPPGGETLVNFATNFYTEAGPFERSVTLVGQRVDLRIWPSRFDWAYGDGEAASTTEPGAAYPDLEVTHEYLRAGQVGPRVDTTYSAEFRVNGGAWQPVVGTVTMAGEPVGLQVRTATPTLVGY